MHPQDTVQWLAMTSASIFIWVVLPLVVTIELGVSSDIYLMWSVIDYSSNNNSSDRIITKRATIIITVSFSDALTGSCLLFSQLCIVDWYNILISILHIDSCAITECHRLCHNPRGPRNVVTSFSRSAARQELSSVFFSYSVVYRP